MTQKISLGFSRKSIIWVGFGVSLLYTILEGPETITRITLTHKSFFVFIQYESN